MDRKPIDDTRYDLENILYGYYIKYSKMQELVNNAFINTPSCNTIDIYIDIFDMLKPIYGKNIYSNKKYVIVSSVINLAAHMREYFITRHRMYTRIFLVYADGTNHNHKKFYKDFGDDSYMNTYKYLENKEFVSSQLDMIKLLVAYIRDVYFIKRTSTFPMFVFDNINKNKNIPAIVLTKNLLSYQIPAFVDNVAVFRPKKYNGEDSSFYINNTNLYKQYFSKITNNKTMMYLDIISEQFMGLLMSVTANKSLGITSVINAPVIIRILYEAIVSNKILNSYMADSKYIYDNLPELSKYINYEDFSNRYNAVDLIYQSMIYENSPESLDQSWYINLQDPDTVKDINNKYFIDNPLYLESL